MAKHVAILGAPSPAPALALAPAPECPLACPCRLCSLSLFLFLALQPQARATALTWFWSRSSSYLSRLPVSYLPALVLMSGAWATCPPSPGSSFFFLRLIRMFMKSGKVDLRIHFPDPIVSLLSLLEGILRPSPRRCLRGPNLICRLFYSPCWPLFEHRSSKNGEA